MNSPTKSTSKMDLHRGPFLFVVNPNSGVGAYRQFYQATEKPEFIGHKIVESTSHHHMIGLAKSAISEGYRACIAVGGDGTVHGIASELIGSDVALGIIPTGSGNGIARHLGVSMNITTALNQMLNSSLKKIDTIIVNDHRAIGFCGIGFDAHVAKLFDETPGRGFGNYVQHTFGAFQSYKMKSISVNDTVAPCFSLIIANVSQLGNNAFINPNAIDDDGKLEVVKIQSPLWADVPFLISRLFNKTFHLSKYVTVDQVNSISIINEEGLYLQIDGEPLGSPKKINIKVDPKSLNVLTP
ncbi:diacylglycerol kinase family protein [Salibacteraceae bacterium]|nr:diacylglycerol kinase family protein [Salibacteraceae bacterium]